PGQWGGLSELGQTTDKLVLPSHRLGSQRGTEIPGHFWRDPSEPDLHKLVQERKPGCACAQVVHLLPQDRNMTQPNVLLVLRRSVPRTIDRRPCLERNAVVL